MRKRKLKESKRRDAMKRILFLLYILIILLIGCPPDYDFGSSTFYEISAPYLEQYGQPEEIDEYKAGAAYLIDWWWWSQGFNVTFSNWNDGATKNSNGWQVESTYSFPPI